MPTYPVTEASEYVSPQQMEAFKKALADAETEGKEVYEVFISNGVPVLYSIRDRP